MSVLVRAMNSLDLADVSILDALSFNTPWPAKAFEHELANANARCWVAELDRHVVGALVLWRVLDEAHIATVAVHPQYRRRGIARTLFKTATDAGQAEGAQIYHLEVRAGNAAAIQLYEAFGFALVGRRPRYYKDTGEDALLMSKLVD